MKRFAQCLGRSAFGIGMAIGLVVNVGLTPLCIADPPAEVPVEVEVDSDGPVEIAYVQSEPKFIYPDPNAAMGTLFQLAFGVPYAENEYALVLDSTEVPGSWEVNVYHINTTTGPFAQGMFIEDERYELPTLGAPYQPEPNSQILAIDFTVLSGDLDLGAFSGSLCAFENRLSISTTGGGEPDLAMAAFVPLEIAATLGEASVRASAIAGRFSGSRAAPPGPGPNSSQCVIDCLSDYQGCMDGANISCDLAVTGCYTAGALMALGCVGFGFPGVLICWFGVAVALDACLFIAKANCDLSAAACISAHTSCLRGCGVEIVEN